jgi:spermidine synthase
VLAACSILYELVAAQTLALLCANTVVWYSLTVGVFLAAMGAGSLWSGRLGRARSAWHALFWVELGLIALGAAIYPALHVGHVLFTYLTMEGPSLGGKLIFFGGAFALVAGVGVLTGVELPLLIRIARARSADDTTANTVLGLDYLGSLLGAVLFPVVLLPRLSLLAIGCGTAFVNLAVAATVLGILARGERAGRARRGVVTAAVGVALVAVAANAPRIQQYLLRKYYYYYEAADAAERDGLLALFAPMPDLPAVQRWRSPYQRIDLMRDVEPDPLNGLIDAYSDKADEAPSDYPWDRILFLNGDFQTNTRFEEIYHEYFAHVPIIARGAVPKRVLVMGGGDGYLIRELVKYDAIESITHVDIDPVLPKLARRNPTLLAANHGSFLDPRVTTRRMDGYQYARRTDDTYDAVYIDFPVAADYDLAKLYSREFFFFVRHLLNPGGFAVFDSTGTGWLTPPSDGDGQEPMPGNDWGRYYNTLRKAGWAQIVPYLTTLEVDNPAAVDKLLASGLQFVVDEKYVAAWNTAASDAARVRIERSALKGVLGDWASSLQQGLIMMANEPNTLRPVWHDPGVELHLLNEERFHKAFEVEFPMPREIDDDLVNSIMRPTFPSTPVDEPRVPF